MRLVKLFSFNVVCLKIILREYFFDEILLDKKKANYGTTYNLVKVQLRCGTCQHFCNVVYNSTM